MDEIQIPLSEDDFTAGVEFDMADSTYRAKLMIAKYFQVEKKHGDSWKNHCLYNGKHKHLYVPVLTGNAKCKVKFRIH